MSDYFNTLSSENPDVAERYRQKLNVINYVDPFSLSADDLDFNSSNFPAVTKMDIVSYLVLTTSFYTGLQMKASQSLNAYKIFEAGFVSKCRVLKVNNRVVVPDNVSYTIYSFVIVIFS